MVKPTVLDLHQQSIDAHTEAIRNLKATIDILSERLGLLRDRVKVLEGAARAGGVC
jgi:hypothetical protein